MQSNQLINETSPYLIQHAHNPVNWLPWGDEALQLAKNEDKLILISIGYSACHWCHVMEHESFESEEVAQLMNEHFVCIKVDREERPDVDQIYMEAVQMISGRGGWPLNCFALPDGRPIWGGTYFQKQQWMEILQQLATLYSKDKEKLHEQAKALTEGIRQIDIPALTHNIEWPNVYKSLLKHTSRFDLNYGGFDAAPKFPMPVALNLIHQIGHIEQGEELLSFVYLTLDRMAAGGIYDQAGGGFARYSVDERWFAPHFEKMLYDNAQLVSLYSNAYKTSGNAFYKDIVEETVRFIERELSSPDGAFYSALDADSEGVEGKFYVWTHAELIAILGDNEHFYKYYDITKAGNWEHNTNILHGAITKEEYAKRHKIDYIEFKENINSCLAQLLMARKERVRPGLDDKILTSWNALMVKGLCDAYQSFGNEHYLKLAQDAMSYLLQNSKKQDGRLLRTSKNGVSKIDAFLDDYAFTIDALISLYEVTFDEKYLDEAKQLSDYTIANFYNSTAQIFYYNSKAGEQLIARKSDLQDNVTPSSVGSMANNLMRLHQLFHLPAYESIATSLIGRMSQTIEKHPTYYAQWALLSALQTDRQELVICGSEAVNYRKTMQAKFIPGVVYAGAKSSDEEMAIFKDRFKEGITLIYKCKNKTCELPIDNPHAFND